MTQLDPLKNFLADRPEYAFLAFALLTIGILWRALRKAEAEKLELALRVIPLADKLQVMLQKVLTKRSPRRPSQPPTPVQPPPELP